MALPEMDGLRQEQAQRQIESAGRALERMAARIGKEQETQHVKPGTRAISRLLTLWLPKTPSDLKTQRFQSFVRSWCYHDELSFRRPFRSRPAPVSNPCRPAGGDPRASSPTRSFPKERAASFALSTLRPTLVGLAVAMVARLAP